MKRFVLFLTINHAELDVVNNVVQSLQKRIVCKSKQFESESLKVSWFEPNNETEWKSICDFNVDQCSFYQSCDLYQVAEKIHLLANSLPTPGTYSIDVIWIWNSENKFVIDDEIELFGSLKRLVLWHNAYIYIVDELKHEESKEWAQMLEGEIISPTLIAENFCPWSTFWKGNLSLRRKDSNENDVLCGFHLIKNENEDESEDVKSLTSTMTVVCECNANSIPNFLINGKTLTLCVKSRSNLVKNSSEWLEKFNSNSEVALIIRLEYTTTNFIFNVNPTTENWMKMIKNGKIPGCLTPVIKNSRQFCFIAIADSTGLARIKLHFVRNPNSNLGAYFVNNLHPSQIAENDLLKSQLENLNVYDQDWIYQALKIVKEREIRFRDDHESEKSAFELRKKILDSLFSQKISTATDIFTEKNKPKFTPEYLVDENDWPERISLMQIELERRNSQEKPNVLSELHPSITQNFVGDCNYILKCFGEDGKSKPKRQMAPVTLNVDTQQCPMRTRLSENDFASAQWPDLKECQYPDVYYNRNNSIESYENDCSQIKQQLVVDETASTLAVNFRTKPQKRKLIPKEENIPLRRSPRNKKKRKLHLESQDGSEQIQKKEKKRVKKSILSDDGYAISEKHKMKLRAAVYDVLSEHGISTKHALFQVCGGKLFNICRTFVKDMIKHGRTSEQMRKIANAHVKQVIEFEKQLDEFRKKVATP